MHPGGANFALGDGSVRFLKETIATSVYQALGTKANGEVKNGVLTIHLPKTEQARQRTRKIPVRA